MDKEFEILRIESIKEEDKIFKNNILVANIICALGTVLSIYTWSNIIKYNIPITTHNNLNKILYLFGIAGVPISILSGILSVTEMKDYNEFKKENKELLKRK